jgi:hypothetical protein
MELPTNIVWHNPTVTRERRQKGNGCRTFVLDGGNVRHGMRGSIWR